MNTQPNTTQHNNTSERNNHTDPELQHNETDKIINVQFAEEQPKVADDARLGTSLVSLPVTQEIQMPDASWFAAKQLAKPVVLARKDWTSDSDANADIYTVGFPAALQTVDTIHQETLRMYSFYKFNFTFRIQLNGTKFHSGQLLCSWDPFSQFTTNTNFRPFNVYSATGNPHVLLNASTNEPVEITIPYFHPKNFLATNNADDDNDLGTFRITVLNKLRFAEGSSPKLHLTVWFYAHSPSVHVPIYRHDYVVSNNTNILRSKPVLEPTMETIGNAIGSIFGEDAGKAVTSGGNAVGNFFTGNFGDSLRDAGDTLHHTAAALGLDYPTRIITNLTQINPLGPMAVGKGVDSSYSLRLNPQGMQVITPDRKGNTAEECDLDYIKRVPMLIDTITWTDSEDSGFLLTSWPVTPNICKSYDNGGITLSTNTFLSYLSGLFQFWRGSIDYRLDFVSTQFHTGRLLVAFVPNLPQTAKPTFEQALSCPNVVIDIQESSSITFSVPFLSQTPYKNTETLADVLSLTGVVYVYVLNELVRPSNVSDTIEFNIYMSAGDDFEFAVPQPFNYLLYSSDIPSETSAVDALPPLEPTMQGLERLETRTGQAISSTKLSMAFGSDMVPPVNTLGEKFSLLDLTKRYARIGENIAVEKPQSIDAFENTVFSRFSTETTPIGTFRSVYTPISVISAMFAGWFGSLRYKFATDASRTAKASLTAMYDPSPNATDRNIQPIDGFCAAMQRTNLDQNNALEIDVPCYTPYNLLCLDTYASVRKLPVSAGRVFYQLEVASAETVTFDIYQAGGDDYRPFYLIAPPTDFARTATQKHYFVARYPAPTQ